MRLNVLCRKQGKTGTKAFIWHENMHRCSSANIICSGMRTGLREQRLRETVNVEELIMSKDKYASIFSREMEAIEFVILRIFLGGKK